MSDLTKTIGQRIRNYRTQRQMKQEQLAELAGCHPTYIGQIERGEKNATLESMEKIAVALGVSLSQLFELIGPQPEERPNYALLCYELVASQKISEQKKLYEILTGITEYKKK